MLCLYLRSSAISTLEFCEHRYLLEYNIGLKSRSNVAATKGTVVHRALQTLGDKNLAIQAGKKTIDFEGKRLHIDKCDDIAHITKLAFDHYTKLNTDLTLSHLDLRDCIAWVNKTIEFNNGQLDPRKQNVYATELFFDFEIKRDWARYRHELNGKMVEGYLGVKGTIDLITKEGENYYGVLDYKGLPIDTQIPTLNGWTTMGDLKIGDFVFDQYGNKTKVVAKSEQKFKECYEIEFDDTSKVVCDDEHYWKLEDGSVVQIKDLKIGSNINTAKSLVCDNKELPIDPYTLGVWLGDGRNKTGEICSADKFIFEEIERRGFKVGQNLDKRSSKCESRTIFGLRTKLREANLLHNKHIPNIYFRASHEQRLDLLRGLMDSDGSVNTTRKQCVFMNCRQQLSNDLKHLLLTLGQRPLISNTIAKGFGLTVKAFPVSFRAININPFLLPAKRDKLKIEWGSGLSHRRKIVKIEKIGIKLTQCISVDSEDRTYLCTENMIPTHNTGQRKNWATGQEKTYDSFEKDTQLLLYYYALKNLYPEAMFEVAIHYINHGGLFSFPFDETHYKRAESMIKQKFQYISNVEIPRMLSPDNTNWKCQRLCSFSKIRPGTNRSECQFYHDEIVKNGLMNTVNKYADFSKLGAYQDGGGRTA